MKPKFKSGEAAIDFSGTLINGEKFKLSDLKGKFVLLDFWGSWCGPCRAENPLLVQLNQQFQSKNFVDASGFEIVSIGVETNENSWKRAIEKDGLNWKYHIMQTQSFSSPIPKIYGVREIPTKYLLDTSGNVIMTNPSVQEVAKFLEKKLK